MQIISAVSIAVLSLAILICSDRDLNPSFGLERAASLTGLDDEKSEEFLPAIFKHLNYFSSRIEPAFPLSIRKFKFISASGSLLFANRTLGEMPIAAQAERH